MWFARLFSGSIPRSNEEQACAYSTGQQWDCCSSTSDWSLDGSSITVFSWSHSQAYAAWGSTQEDVGYTWEDVLLPSGLVSFLSYFCIDSDVSSGTSYTCDGITSFSVLKFGDSRNDSECSFMVAKALLLNLVPYKDGYRSEILKPSSWLLYCLTNSSWDTGTYALFCNIYWNCNFLFTLFSLL